MTKDEVMNLFYDDVKERRIKISQYIKDNTNSYEDRLEVWKNTPEHLYTQEFWIVHLTEFDKKYGEISWFEDFYAERYSIVDLTDAAEYNDDWEEEKVKDFNTECMNMGIHSFKLDW